MRHVRLDGFIGNSHSDEVKLQFTHNRSHLSCLVKWRLNRQDVGRIGLNRSHLGIIIDKNQTIFMAYIYLKTWKTDLDQRPSIPWRNALHPTLFMKVCQLGSFCDEKWWSCRYFVKQWRRKKDFMQHHKGSHSECTVNVSYFTSKFRRIFVKWP